MSTHCWRMEQVLESGIGTWRGQIRVMKGRKTIKTNTREEVMRVKKREKAGNVGGWNGSVEGTNGVNKRNN